MSDRQTRPHEEPEDTPISGHRGDVRPVPDPTKLTTEQLYRETGALREVLETRLAGEVNALRIAIETRLDGIDRATALRGETITAIVPRIDEKVAAIAGIYDEKFAGIQTQFRERDTRVEQTARDTKVAVDAALQAAEKAVGKQNESFALSQSKSETAVVKQIDQQGLLIATSTKALDEKIDDCKERLTRLEGRGEGSLTAGQAQQVATQTQQGSSGNIIAFVGVAVAILLGVASLLVALLRHA